MAAHYLFRLTGAIDLAALPTAVLEVPVTTQLLVAVDGITVICDTPADAAEFVSRVFRDELERRRRVAAAEVPPHREDPS